jgi:release factor glutamine methyltransferase
VTVVDVSRRALLTAVLNARLNGVRVRPRRGDLFDPVAGERFDIVVSNPPYLPSSTIPRRGASRAWEGGGVDGRSILERICATVAQHLEPRGTVLLVHSSVNGVSRTLEALEAGGLSADVIARERGPLGPLLAARRPDLDEEEIVIVRGRLP